MPPTPTPALMILGTHSNAGKSLLVTAFCRIFARRGIRVAPFKAQNMSNNAGVTATGGEMGRAQLVQAEAAGLLPHTDMNPVLLKPETAPDGRARSQVVLNGKVIGHLAAHNWFDLKRQLWDEVRAAYDRLAAQYELIILEGAGSPAEINLKQGDIVNLRMARHAQAPCLLVGDIDRGGVFAALAGTLLLLEPAERAQIQGFLINKFRGSPALLGNINEFFREKAFGVPTVGVIPYLPDLQIADEDAVALDSQRNADQTSGALDIAVIQLPHVANFDEFALLAAEPGVRVRYVREAHSLGTPQVILLPGTKATLADLAWLRERALDQAILAAPATTQIVGICGGYQILGQRLADPLGIESTAGTVAPGLGLLPVTTEFHPSKQTSQSRLRLADGTVVTGYEIHSGESTLLHGEPLGAIIERNGEALTVADGAMVEQGRIWGCYLHGIFEDDTFRQAWLHRLGWQGTAQSTARLRAYAYDRLADAVESAVDWSYLEPMLAGLAARG
ncbi:MAG: cobyric acid synthase [Caldilineaceae bacterium]|nr:cobyric acid synthase [Caldilineaceae bacterium]